MIVKYWFQLLRWLTFTYITMNHPSWKLLPRKIVELLKNSATPTDSSMISPRSITMDTCSNSKKGFTQKELVLNKEYKEDNRATFLHLESHIKDGKFYTKTYDKRKACNFEIVNDPDLSGNIPERPAYGIYISQVKPYAKVCNQTKDFIDRSDYSPTNCTKNISPKNGCWQPWRNVAGRTLGLWINTAMGWTIIWSMIVWALIHEAGLVIQAPKPVCQFMAEDIPPSILNPYPTTSINSTSHKVPSQPSSQD